MGKNITAIVPVRAGSRRLKNKNISPFAGVNLLLFKLNQLKKVNEINKIIVSSDSDKMLNFAKDMGVGTHKRDIEYCDEETRSFGEVVKHIAESVEGDHILWAPCTSPLVFPKIYKNAINKYFEILNEGKFDSLISVEPFRRYMWNEIGPLNYELGLNHVPSQQLPKYYFVSDGVLLAPRKKMIEWSYFHGPNPYKFELDKRASIDIDDRLDLEVAKAWLDLDEAVYDEDPYFL
ncbi:acylneuraminate cytidylyltransferase family protein [Aquirufa sp. 5-AUSEE-100C1]